MQFHFSKNRNFKLLAMKDFKMLLLGQLYLKCCQTEVEFSILMSEHFVGFALSGGTRI